LESVPIKHHDFPKRKINDKAVPYYECNVKCSFQFGKQLPFEIFSLHLLNFKLLNKVALDVRPSLNMHETTDESLIKFPPN
jgi:hypothetical protein